MTHLLEFVGLNMRGVRKILKKFAKNVDPTPPAPGFLALEIAHPHDPNWKLLQVRAASTGPRRAEGPGGPGLCHAAGQGRRRFHTGAGDRWVRA